MIRRYIDRRNGHTTDQNCEGRQARFYHHQGEGCLTRR
jgi:hypothetical protein